MNKLHIKIDEQSTTFSKEDWDNFIEMIEHPPAPTERFKKSAKKYIEILNQQDYGCDRDVNLV